MRHPTFDDPVKRENVWVHVTEQFGGCSPHRGFCPLPLDRDTLHPLSAESFSQIAETAVSQQDDTECVAFVSVELLDEMMGVSTTYNIDSHVEHLVARLG
jgi:hypothetical protein